IDLQDIGCRFYTYMWSMTDMMTACARLGLPVTVLDRPNPLVSTALGPGLDPGVASFVGRFGIALRHGARLGDIARTFAELHLDDTLQLHVIDAPSADGTAPWVPPSPNMPALTTAALYPGTGLLEGTTLCEGRGTTRPFELFGAPWCGPEVAGALRELDLTGVKIREARFRPTHGTFGWRTLHGAQIHLASTSGGSARAPPPPVGFDSLRNGYAIPSASVTRSSRPSHPSTPGSRCGGTRSRDALTSSICCGVPRRSARASKRAPDTRRSSPPRPLRSRCGDDVGADHARPCRTLRGGGTGPPRLPGRRAT